MWISKEYSQYWGRIIVNEGNEQWINNENSQDWGRINLNEGNLMWIKRAERRNKMRINGIKCENQSWKRVKLTQEWGTEENKGGKELRRKWKQDDIIRNGVK